MAMDGKDLREWLSLSFSFLALLVSAVALLLTWSDQKEKNEALVVELNSVSNSDAEFMTRLYQTGVDDYPLLIMGKWGATVSNVSGSTISITGIMPEIEMSGRKTFGGRREFVIDGKPLKLPISLEAGKSIGFEVVQAVFVPKKGSEALGVLSLVPKTEAGLSRRMNDLMVSAFNRGTDIFGNSEVGYLVANGKVFGFSVGGTVSYNPTLHLKIKTARGNEFSSSGAWYSIGK